MIPWLSGDAPFPSVGRALRSPNGLLAAGGELSVSRLLDAYRNGIFPWFNPGEPILWWSPDPRMVLIPGEFKLSHSLAKVLRNHVYEVRFNTAFEQVMRACAAPRRGHHSGTWIGENMIAAYCELHRMGYAHSVETWMHTASPFQNESGANTHKGPPRVAGGMELVGGLYGVCIGRMFYGESMFSKTSNASKIALAHLARQLERWFSVEDFAGRSDICGTGMIDCQMSTSHLASLGAREIPRGEFIERLQELVHCTPVTRWQFDADIFK